MLVVLASARPAAAEEPFDSPLRPPDTSSPRATLQSFLDNVQEAYEVLMPVYASYRADPTLFPTESARDAEMRAGALLERAVRTLNLSEVSRALTPKVGLERALLLKEVLDRVPIPAFDEIPGAAQAPEGGEAPPEIARWRIPQTEITIARVEEGPHQGEYLFTPATVASLPAFYRQVRELPYRPGASEGFYEFVHAAPGLLPPPWFEWIRGLPDWTKASLWGQAVWQWTALILAILLAALLPLLANRWRRYRGGLAVGRSWRRFLVPVSLILAAWGVHELAEGPLNLTGTVLKVVLQGTEVLMFLGGAWAAISFCGVVAELIISSPRISREGLDANLLRFGFRLLGFVIAVIIIVTGLADVGVPVAPMAAGLGVGGLAVALAAQSTLENLIASLALYFDKPLKVGDFCRYGDDLSSGSLRIGTVEEIGLRSTRLRGIDRTVTAIPNADFAKLQLINLTLRDQMLLRTTISLRYETTAEQLRFLLAKLREMLLAHPKITEVPARVRFAGFGDYSLNVDIFAYADTPDWNQFLAIQEDVYLRIIDIVEEAGTGFAFPSQTTYLAEDAGLSASRGEAAETQVQAWRDDEALPFPEFAQAHRERIWNTLNYPPKGAPPPAAMSATPEHVARKWLGLKWRRKNAPE